MDYLINGVEMGIVAVLAAILVWMLVLAIRDGLKSAARLTERDRQPTAPTSVVPTVRPLWEYEVQAILNRLAIEEVEARDEEADR